MIEAERERDRERERERERANERDAAVCVPEVGATGRVEICENL